MDILSTLQYSRREWLRQAVCLTATAVGYGCAPRAATPEPPLPNVLFIVVDDLNDWVGYLGSHPDARTPNIDRMAARGMVFENAHCAAPVCHPSRVAVMTGKAPTTTGIYDNLQPMRGSVPDVVTLPQHFRRQGYYVAGGGKVYHGGRNDPESWDTWFDPPRDPLPPDELRPLSGIDYPKPFDWGPIDVPDEAMGDSQVVDWGIAQLAAPLERPFFLALGLYRPHVPMHVPSPYFDQFPPGQMHLPPYREDDLADLPPFAWKLAAPEKWHRAVVAGGLWKSAIAAYLACIAYVDAQLGRLLRAVDDSPHARNTVIVFWGDNGYHLGEKQHWSKMTLWERSTRVPLTITGPGVATGRCRRPVSLTDLYPTLCDLCNLPTPEGLDGQSLAPQTRDPRAPREQPVLTTYDQYNHAVRSERWRYIGYEDGTEELYDHETDPNEWTNLADLPEHGSVKAELARWLPRNPAAPATRIERTWRPR